MFDSQLISSGNWVDFLCIFILVRVLFIALKRGFIDEVFKTLSVYLSLIVGVQFSPFLGVGISERVPLPIDSSKTFVFFVIIVLTLVIFKFIRTGFSIVFKVETISVVNRLGALVLGLLRAYLCACLIFIFFLLSNIDYLKVSANDSLLYPYIVGGAKGVYNISYLVLNKFSPDLEKNEEMEEL